MRKMSILVLLASALVLLASCNSNDERLPMLYGDWEGVAWTDADGKRVNDPSQVRFSFAEDAGYTADMGQQSEAGNFVFRDAKLYTTATGDRKVEKVVAVESLDGDTLVFNMNRSGNPELLVLARQ